ncbi:23S rRNA (adenine(2503)-C(2))-methyltransferase RlmN [Natranaerofaba carboxydovora]|uniref:23S rRNA (adenine(2503)-C(2))-methyltransferase RlmN n=1 Tax=Natranaerofaba carboxydovora TaxID=2742683 RepID=UPI001F12D163|nr:23S rRNA (adenine(2503)-C(2))-methyltransferase RlmN [Natranaerofaba carboxydovora]UMZ73301.1 putative dual-specificity RNA methyltransferase RlmN [Natranaerofaba carboxydovora]
MSKTKKAIKNLSTDEVKYLIKEMGEPSYRADQILDWLYKKKATRFDEMTNLPNNLRENLKNELETNLLTLVKKMISNEDGTEKFLYKTQDGELLECALMKQDYGNTICVSSQIGCGLACAFCASSKGGFVRNLTSGEMLDQFILSEKYSDDDESIKNIVVMGMGEPLYNYSNLINFLKTVNSEKGLGISYRNVTVSTCGIVPKIIKLSEERLPITLAISLHAPDDKTRSKIMPINEKYSIKDILDSCKIYMDKVGRRVTFEYILIKGVNDSIKKAKDLSRLLKGLLCHVNLIPVNPIDEFNMNRPEQKQINDFYETLRQNKISVSIRKERGTDIEGACGQLRSKYSHGCK